MWPDRVSNPGPLAYESGALPTALRGPATSNALDKLNLRTFDHLILYCDPDPSTFL